MLRSICLSALLLLAPVAQAAGFQPKAPAVTGYVLTGMPLVWQTYNACGPASITQVLAYYGVQRSLSEVSRATRKTERSYMTAQAIVEYAPTVGMEARLYSGGTLNTVRQAIANRLPLIALQSHITSEGKTIPHWRVIVGFDDARQQIYLMDPLLGYILMSYSDFNRVWNAQSGQFAVMYPEALRQQVRQAIG